MDIMMITFCRNINEIIHSKLEVGQSHYLVARNIAEDLYHKGIFGPCCRCS